MDCRVVERMCARPVSVCCCILHHVYVYTDTDTNTGHYTDTVYRGSCHFGHLHDVKTLKIFACGALASGGACGGPSNTPFYLPCGGFVTDLRTTPTTMQPCPSHGGFPTSRASPVPYPYFPFFFFFSKLAISPARRNTYTYPAIPMPLGTRIHKPYPNHYRPTPHPRRHGGYPPAPALRHQPANHPQTKSSAYPRALKRGGRRRRTPPTTTILPATHPPVLNITIKSGQLTLLNLSPRHQNYTTPPHHRA